MSILHVCGDYVVRLNFDLDPFEQRLFLKDSWICSIGFLIRPCF